MTAAAPRLQMKGVSKRFGATQALSGVELELCAGEVHALVGENGAGKSTLMKVLSGALKPDEGSLWLDGQPYAPASPAEGRKAGVAMIYQELSLAPHLSIVENLCLGLEPGWGPFLKLSEARNQTQGVLKRLGLESLDPDTVVESLPLAQRQLIEIGRALLLGCRVLVLDEPTSSLGSGEVRTLFSLIRELASQGVAVAYISHFLEELREISDHFTVLRDGAQVATGVTFEVTNEQIVSWMAGRKVEEFYHHSVRVPGEMLLEIKDLEGASKSVFASLTLRRGEVLGIAGLVGSGRSELLRILQGLDPLLSGELRVGAFSGWVPASRRWAEGLGFVSEDRKTEGLALGLSISDNVTLPRLGDNFFGFLSPSGLERRSQHWIKELGVKCVSPGQEINALSGGNQQKAALARLLDADCQILLLDEPTRGIDVGAKAEIFRLIDALASQGKAVIMVSSYLPDLLGACDRIAVMHKGHLGEAKSASLRNAHEILMEATGALEKSA
jgi:ribose transport system ATP-binding protein